MGELSDKNTKRLKALIYEAETSIAAVKEMILSINGEEPITKAISSDSPAIGKVIEGVFDGQTMIVEGNKSYPVPANYASKSKLVQGDIMKLTIAPDGTFMYKQIGPVARRQLVGTLTQSDGHFFIETPEKNYRVLLASVTYFKVHPGDQVSINVPEDKDIDAEWAAIEAAL
jgi:hypothetical protein